MKPKHFQPQNSFDVGNDHLQTCEVVNCFEVLQLDFVHTSCTSIEHSRTYTAFCICSTASIRSNSAQIDVRQP